MFYKKKGKPAIGETVLCTVKKILYHSVFVSIDDYTNLDGMIHISEIAPGRIRNLRDYVIEGKKIICKVLDINSQGQFDLSLRRITTGVMVNKLKEYKQEEKAEKMIEQVCKEFNMTLPKFYETLGDKIVEKYGGLYPFFQTVSEKGKSVIDELSSNTKLNESLLHLIKEKIKPVEIKIDKTVVVKSFNSHGVEDVKKILSKLAEHKINVHYLGAPKYKVSFVSTDYKKAENVMKKGVESATDCAKKLGCEFTLIEND